MRTEFQCIVHHPRYGVLTKTTVLSEKSFQRIQESSRIRQCQENPGNSISSLLLTPKEFVKELNQILFHFLWKGPDKVTRVSVINEYDKGGLKMTDVDSMVMSLRLAWLKRLLIFGSNDGFWKRYLLHLLEPYGGFFFFKCNFDIRDYPNLPQFYSELLQWWSEFPRNVLHLKRTGFT